MFMLDKMQEMGISVNLRVVNVQHQILKKIKIKTFPTEFFSYSSTVDLHHIKSFEMKLDRKFLSLATFYLKTSVIYN